MKSSSRFLSFTSALALSALGCSPQYIPNTDVADNDFNRDVIAFCEDYRHAVEKRNVAMLLKLADRKYYEDGGSVDTSDDLDFEGLKAYLDLEFSKTRSIRYEIFYRDVTTGRANQVFVDYTYSASYKVPSPQGEVWRRRVADNRLELVRDGEHFRILSGM
ncbi:MAG TPA: hypothetical protein VIW29_22315 [Polyangiaceae bacterium]